MISKDSVLDDIRRGFYGRKIPKARLIKASVDMDYNIEARNIENYFRRNESVKDRQNSVTVGFHYFTPEAALWALPLYMESIIENFSLDDYLHEIALGVLASGYPDLDAFASGGKLGLEMKDLATADEAKAVCRFCRWLVDENPDVGGPGTFEAALSIWCEGCSD